MQSEYYYSRMLDALPQRSPRPILVDPKNVARPKTKKLYPFQQLTPTVTESLKLMKVVKKDRPLLDKNRFFVPLFHDRDQSINVSNVRIHGEYTGPTLERPMMLAAEMKSEFRRLTGKYGKQSELKRLCHWGPNMLSEVRELTKSFPSPHPLRIAVCIYIIEAMTDFHNISTDLRRELFAGLYTNGENVDDLLCNGVTSSIIDSILCQESACVSRKAELLMEKQVESLETRHNTKMRRKEIDTRTVTRSSLRQYFTHWHRLSTRPFSERAISWRSGIARRHILLRALFTWKDVVWSSRTRRSEEQHAQKCKILQKKHEDEIQLLQHDCNDKVASLKSKIARLEEQLQLLKSEEGTNEEVEILTTQNAELSERVKELSKENHNNREASVIASLQVEGLTDTLSSLFKVAKNSLNATYHGQRPGVRASDIIESRLSSLGSMDDYSLREPDAIHKTAADCPATDYVLRTFLNFVLSMAAASLQKERKDTNSRPKFLRRVNNFSRDLSDCEILVVATTYLWPESFREAMRILDTRSLPDRADKFVNLFKSFHPRCYMEWLRGSEILEMNTLVNMNIIVLMLERYRQTHVLQHYELPSTGLSESMNGRIDADVVTDDLMELHESRTRSELNKSAMEELVATLRDGVFSLAMYRVTQPKVSEVWATQEMSLWYSYSDDRLSTALHGLSTTECDNLRSLFHENCHLIETVFSYYSNLTTAFQGVCLPDFLRLCSDCQLPVMKSLSGKARVENLFTTSHQLQQQQGIKGLALGELMLVLIRLMDEKFDEATSGTKPESTLQPQNLTTTTNRERSLSVASQGGGGGGAGRRGRSSVFASAKLSPRSRVSSLLSDYIAPRSSRADVKGFKDCYWSLAVQTAIQVHSRMLGSVYDYFSRRDESNRGNNTTISLDEWLKLTKDLECRDAQLTRIDATLIFNTSQDPNDGTSVSELSYREFLEAFFALSLCRISNPLLPIPVRFHTFCSDRLIPVLRRKYPQIKTTHQERTASTVS
eukprot:TRINITY_DN15220_c0_g1_i1.p1 TRINITY_DN15220_c0_g1~~TRINITY_DN15220_c0_g1_i1.p1  ORF type:complete len:1003 (+),score=163.67 TRINITY_DN15220_c0_g1_i1:44-3052(+)